MDPQQQHVADEFDKYKDNYSDAVNRSIGIPGVDVDYFTKVKAEILKDTLRKLHGDTTSLRVLDVGCGVGNFHALLAGAFRELVGVDVSEACLTTAKERHPDVEYHHYDGARLPFEDDALDVAFAVCVVHHVPPDQWPSFFRELARVTRRGGHVLIFEHNPLNPLTQRVVNNCPFDEDAVLLRQRKVKELMKSAGLVEVRSRSILSIPSFGRVTRRIDRALGRLPLGAQFLTVGTK